MAVKLESVTAKLNVPFPVTKDVTSNETQVLYETDGIQPPTATPQDRMPKDGTPIQ